MKAFRLVWILALAAPMVMPLKDAAGGSRRLLRRQDPCPEVTQPCQPFVVPNECTCAFWQWMNWGSYSSYYSIDWQDFPTCASGNPLNLDGNFQIISFNPCSGCDSRQCIGPYGTRVGALAKPVKGHGHKPGTKLQDKLKWNDPLVLKPKETVNGVEYSAIKVGDTNTTPEKDGRIFVQINLSTGTYYAKCHPVEVSAKKGLVTTTIQVNVGNEIENPPNSTKKETATSFVRADTNVGYVTVDNVDYQVIFKSNLPAN